MNSVLNGHTTKQDLMRAIELVYIDGCWSYSRIQRDMRLPYQRAKSIKDLLTGMGILDDQMQLDPDWREKPIEPMEVSDD